MLRRGKYFIIMECAGYGRLAQWLERLPHTQEATGSSPVAPTTKGKAGFRVVVLAH